MTFFNLFTLLIVPKCHVPHVVYILYIINDCFFNARHYFFEFCEENVKILKSVSLFMVLALSNHRSNEILL